MKKLIITLIILGNLIFNACEPPRSNILNITKTFYNNTTSYTIKFLPYKNGLVITDSIKVFLPYSITLLERSKYFMPSATTDFVSNYQQFTDSIIVIFDDIKKEKHNYLKSYIPNKERSIYSNYSDVYLKKIIEQRKNFIEVEFTYTFIEQDYLDAEFIK